MRLIQQKPWFGTLRNDFHWSTQGLVFASPFRPNQRLIDYSYLASHGDITGATWAGQGLDFNPAEEDYVEVPAKTGRFSGPDFTIISKFHVRSLGTDNSGRLIQFGTDNTFSEWSGNNFIWRRDAATNGRWFMTDPLITFPSTITLAITQVGIEAPKFYLDGVSVGVSEIDAPAGAPTTLDGKTIRIAARNHPSTFRVFDSIIFDFKIYNRALNASQIQALSQDLWLPFKQDRLIFAPTAGAVRLVNGGLIDSGLVGGRLIA